MPALCPRCERKAVRRSKRRGVIESTLLSLIRVRPFRCMDCDRRFYGLAFQTSSIQSKSVIAP
jgi:ribosomal protein L37AE/L43A